jgi:hypothetical protein
VRLLIGTLLMAGAFAYVLFSPLVRERRRHKGGDRDA